jgi:hypothetical protein
MIDHGKYIVRSVSAVQNLSTYHPLNVLIDKLFKNYSNDASIYLVLQSGSLVGQSLNISDDFSLGRLIASASPSVVSLKTILVHR